MVQSGDRIRLIAMPDDPNPVPPGTTGTVTGVRNFSSPVPASRSLWQNGRPVQTGLPSGSVTAQVDVEWDDGRTLMLLLPKDRFAVLTDRGDA